MENKELAALLRKTADEMDPPSAPTEPRRMMRPTGIFADDPVHDYEYDCCNIEPRCVPVEPAPASRNVFRSCLGCLTDDCDHYNDNTCKHGVPCIIGRKLSADVEPAPKAADELKAREAATPSIDHTPLRWVQRLDGSTWEGGDPLIKDEPKAATSQKCVFRGSSYGCLTDDCDYWNDGICKDREAATSVASDAPKSKTCEFDPPKCPRCNGTGEYVREICSNCAGAGCGTGKAAEPVKPPRRCTHPNAIELSPSYRCDDCLTYFQSDELVREIPQEPLTDAGLDRLNQIRIDARFDATMLGDDLEHHARANRQAVRAVLREYAAMGYPEVK